MKSRPHSSPYDVRKMPWPVLTYDPPYLVPGEEGEKDVNTSISVKLPVQIFNTLEHHCRTMHVGRSAWVREAILVLLSLEQKWINDNK